MMSIKNTKYSEREFRALLGMPTKEEEDEFNKQSTIMFNKFFGEEEQSCNCIHASKCKKFKACPK